MAGVSISHWGVHLDTGAIGPGERRPFHGLPHELQAEQIAAHLADHIRGLRGSTSLRAAAESLLALIAMPTITAEIASLRRDYDLIVEAIVQISDREGRLNARHTALCNAARAMSEAEAEYRKLYGLYGGDTRETGRAWDVMRRTGNSLRVVLNTAEGKIDD